MGKSWTAFWYFDRLGSLDLSLSCGFKKDRGGGKVLAILFIYVCMYLLLLFVYGVVEIYKEYLGDNAFLIYKVECHSIKNEG